jgi:hypothetical protein
VVWALLNNIGILNSEGIERRTSDIGNYYVNDNAFIEAFNGRYKDESLNQSWVLFLF